MIATAVPFRYIDADHSYWLNDERVPSATQLLEMGELVKGAEYYTEAHRRRGKAVHEFTADYDLGALTKTMIDASPVRGYGLGYIAGVRSLKPDWEYIEVADVHPVYRYGVRPDRLGQALDQFNVMRPTVGEIKSGARAKHHAVQTALQALAAARHWGIPPDWWKSSHTERMIQRLCIYVKNTGRFSVDVHEDSRDFDQALSLIGKFCR